MGFDKRYGPILSRCLAPVYKPFIYLSDDNKTLLGPVGEIFNRALKKFSQLNITFVPYKGSTTYIEMGRCVKNNCHGVIEMIRQKKADLWLMGTPLDAFDGETEGFKFGPGIIEMSDMITSVAKLSDTVSVKLDLTTSLKTVNSDVYLTLLFVLIAFILISKLYNFTHSQLNNQKSESVFQILWNLISTGSMQSVFRANTFAQRVLLISFIVGFFIIVSHYHAHLNTNLVIKKAEKNIDTLTDLLESNKESIFLKYGPTKPRFKSSTNPIYQKIWSRADFVTTANLSSFNKLIELVKNQKAAFIGPTIISSLQETIQCYLQSKLKVSKTFYYSKQQFNKIIWIFFYSDYLDEFRRSQFNLIAYICLEHGIYTHLAKDMLNVIKYFLASALNASCKKKSTNFHSRKASFIELVSLRNILIFWLLGNVLAILIFTIQLIFNQYLKKKAKSNSKISQKDEI